MSRVATTGDRRGPDHRVLVVWCPDWPVTAASVEAGVAERAPAAVVHANLVQACNAPARAEGVRRGMRRRDAQARCPGLAVLPASPDRDARAFEEVLGAIEEVGPGVAPLRPGLVALRAPGRYYGGEEQAAAILAERLVGRGVWDNRAGVADELFTAEHAARRSAVQQSTVIPRGGSVAFLRALPVEVLDDPDTVSLLKRLGLRSLGDLARLRRHEVRDRFGAHAAWVHQVVAGDGAVHLTARTPPPELARHVDFEPALDSAETIVFSLRRTVEAFLAGVASHGLVCTELLVEARCEGQHPDDEPASSRAWLHPRFFTAADVVDRVRWQLQGDFRSGEVGAPVDRVRLVPLGVVPDATHADALWGGTDEQVAHGLARVQGMVGHEGVVVPVLQGGRSPADRQAWVPWGERPRDLRPPRLPWPGSLPAPAPTRLLRPPQPAQVLDQARRSLVLDDRGVLSGEPVRIRPGAGEPWQPVAAWAGPWPVEELWWEETSRRVARFQVVGVDGRAWLLVLDDGTWWTEAAYD